MARAQAVTPLLEAGKLFIPEGASWVADFIDEMAAFPNGAHDDCVDSTTQALNYLRQEPSFSYLELFDRVNIPLPQRLDKEDLWQKAMMGLPITEEEFDKM